MTQTSAAVSLDGIRDGFVLLSSDCAGDVKEKLEQNGYSISNQTNELIVFSRDIPRAGNADLDGSGVFVEAEVVEVEDVVTLKGRGPIADWKETFVNAEEDEDSRKLLSIPETSEKAHAALAFRHGSDRSVAGQTGLRLRLYDVCFGVLKDSSEDRVRGFFVTELEVCATPFGSWSSLVKHVAADPTVNSLKMDTVKQNSKTGAITGTAGTAGISAQYSSSTTGGHTKKMECFGWEPAVKNPRNNSVKWVWKLTHWDDMSEKKLALPTEWFRGRSELPKLPFVDKASVPALSETDDILLEAQWIVRTVPTEVRTVPTEVRTVPTEVRTVPTEVRTVPTEVRKAEWDIEVHITAELFEKHDRGMKFRQWKSADVNKSYKSRVSHPVNIA